MKCWITFKKMKKKKLKKIEVKAEIRVEVEADIIIEEEMFIEEEVGVGIEVEVTAIERENIEKMKNLRIIIKIEIIFMGNIN